VSNTNPELSDDRIVDLVDKHVGGPTPSYPLDMSDWINFARAVIYADRALLADRERQAGEAVATVIKKGADRAWMSERLGSLPDGTYSLYLASLPAPQAVQADPVDEVRFKRLSRAMDEIMRAADVYWEASSAARWRVRTEMADIVKTVLSARAAAPSPDGKAEQAEAPSDSTLKLAEMILSDCGHSTAVSTRLRDRVAERIERHIATQPTASNAGEREDEPAGVKTLREALALQGVPIGNMVDRHTAIERTLKARSAWQSACTTDAIKWLLDRAALAIKPPAGEQKPIAGEGK
jgi:hypothetical protein